MQDLRLIGVHEDGVHLLLADAEGGRYRVPLDEALRAAARRDRPRLGQLQIEIEGGLRPKDVQSMIRAGLTAEEVAERAGWTVEKVHRYEVPILAEREHVAGLARQVRLRARTGGASAAPTLGARVAQRLRSRELDPDATTWDSRRTDRGLWTVVLLFSAGGRQREAQWDFDPLARTILPKDDEARWLSEDEDTEPPGPIPAPHLAPSARPSRVYDVEAEGGIRGGGGRAEEPVDLMEAMRERSGQRGRRRRGRGADVPGLEHAPEEALPLEELSRPPRRTDTPPPAHGHPEDDPAATRGDRPAAGATAPAKRRRRAGAGAGSSARSEETQPLPQRDRRRPVAAAAPSDDGLFHDALHDQVDDVVPPHQDRDDEVDDHDDLDPPADQVTASRAKPRPATRPSRPSTRKSGRPSVPSWDDIMFGRKGD